MPRPPANSAARPTARERFDRIRAALGPPYFDDGSGRLVYVGDSTELAKRIDRRDVDLLLADPPYGIGWNTDYRRFSRADGTRALKNYSPVAGDKRPFDPSPWLGFRRVVLWGFQFFASALPTGSTLVWQKKRETSFGKMLSDAELAWQKGGYGVYCFKHAWRGRERESERGEFYHPTQKPAALMAWAIRRNDKRRSPCEVILDPYAGSGPTLLAARRLGRFAIGIELDPTYAATIAERLEREPPVAPR